MPIQTTKTTLPNTNTPAGPHRKEQNFLVFSGLIINIRERPLPTLPIPQLTQLSTFYTQHCRPLRSIRADGVCVCLGSASASWNYPRSPTITGSRADPAITPPQRPRLLSPLSLGITPVCFLTVTSYKAHLLQLQSESQQSALEREPPKQGLTHGLSVPTGFTKGESSG